MSNMSLKHWRENVRFLVKRERDEKEHRTRIERWMTAATVISAIATLATAGIGVVQYRASVKALTAADVNRSRADYIGGLNSTCGAYRALAWGQPPWAIIVNELPQWDDAQKTSAVLDLNERLKKLTDLSIGLLIWEDRDHLAKLRAAVEPDINAMIHGLPSSSFETVTFWTAIADGFAHCKSAMAKAILWMQDSDLSRQKTDRVMVFKTRSEFKRYLTEQSAR
ncbi:hypothetical protein ACU8OP_07140 [Rhizobium leguminosarum]